MAIRIGAYRLRLLASDEAPVPVVSVGNLTVGGSGKTPVSSWIAKYYIQRGLQPGIVLRDYGGDEALVHRRLAEDAVVVASADRVAGAKQAVRGGAQVIILDDAFQRLDIDRDLNIVLVSAESSRAAPWTLPAGPWREGFASLARADLVVVTRKRASPAASEGMVRRVVRATGQRIPVAQARLGIAGFRGLTTGQLYPVGTLQGTRVLAAPGIADPKSFAAQCRDFGAEVRLLPFEDHRGFSVEDVKQILHLSRRVDYVVVTEKDAVKLGNLWPQGGPEPLVATLDVLWESGQTEVEAALDMAVFGAVND
jgi:tetraacyldisaccharide 4'-kinase